MKTIIYAHPWDKSYNHAILEEIILSLDKKNDDFQVIDLYKDDFNPVYSTEELRLFSRGESPYSLVKNYQKKISETSELIFIFPIWWFDLPAILKGFLDKVMLKHFAYDEDSEGNWKGLLTHIEKVTVITTAVFSKDKLIERGNAIRGVFMDSTLTSLGIPSKDMKWIHFSKVNRTTEKQRKDFLKQLSLLI